MITLTHTSEPLPQPETCVADSAIWDTVLGRRPGWPLKSRSLATDSADAALMFSLVDDSLCRSERVAVADERAPQRPHPDEQISDQSREYA